MKYPANIREEELKNRISTGFFDKFDTDKIVGNIDFAVKLKRKNNAFEFDDEYLLWAETKQKPTDTLVMLTQLVLTIGKARTFDEIMPPKFLGCFDNEKIAFIPYHEIQDIFYQNDFNWNVTSSNHETREFQLIKTQIDKIINHNLPFVTYQFYFEKDEKELRKFIKENFIVGKNDIAKIKIDKNNFKIIFNKWADSVMPSISVNWDNVKKSGLLAGDFYLADLLSENNKTLKEKLFVLLQNDYYEIDRHLNEFEIFTSSKIDFKDSQKAHNEFWNKYERPPHEDYWDFIINRRDLLVPPDVRERKGSFFTPKIWVELSQKYLADVFGENWQEEYYIWDCCAGTGNLLEGLTDKYRIFASTLDKQDVFVMLDRIKNGANLLENHVFQFDFLNDDFNKLPESLQKIINNEQLRKKLIIYINPPYAEATNARTATGTGESKNKVATAHKTNDLYKREIGNASNELFAQFFMRIYKDIPDTNLASFSTLKYVNAPNFVKFRNVFNAEYKKGFAVPANTFDNVNGQFPIGFLVWKFTKNKFPKKINVDIFNNNAAPVCKKKFYSEPVKNINDWVSLTHKSNDNVGTLYYRGNDFQNQKYIYISLQPSTAHDARFGFNVTNFISGCVYFAVRHCITATWLNDRDQFLYPNKKWEKDLEFQNDCLAFTLFDGQNKISVNDGINHWIPFTENQIDAAEAFESHFMSSFISGKIKQNGYVNLFEQANEKNCIKREFSPEAATVFDAGRELWKYYHEQKNINVNASLYDIREYFQGRNDKGKMNNKSTDEKYNELIGALRDKLKILAKKIEPKIYEYEFLKK